MTFYSRELKKMLPKYISKIIGVMARGIIFLRIIEIIDRAKDIQNLKKNIAQTKVDGGVFYPSAIVHNLSGFSERIKIGNNSHIRGELLVFPYGGEISIGKNCYIGEGTRVWAGELIKIGDNVGISHNVNIMDFSHEDNHVDRTNSFCSLVKHGHPKEKGKIPTSPIIIEDFVYIYPNACISRGITIGKGSQISAGSVVIKDVEPFSIVMGNPARTILRNTENV